MSDEIEKKVKAIIAEQISVPVEKVHDEAKFIEDLGADSLDIVELMMNIEEAFDVDIPDDEAEKDSHRWATLWLMSSSSIKSSSSSLASDGEPVQPSSST